MLTAWRIIPEHRAQTAFDGEGARLYGGRWNSPGHPVVYAAESRALAALEVLVHLNAITLRPRYAMIEVTFAKSLVETLDNANVPKTLCSPIVDPETQMIGDAWLESKRTPVLAVRSAIITEEVTYLLNPQHPKFSKFKIGKPQRFSFDPRLLN